MTDETIRPKVVLHVGLAKAGTTAIQMAAHARRSDLLDLGVLYPGTEFNHRSASRAVGDHRTGWSQDGKPSSAPAIKHWNKLVAEVHDHPEHTVFISHEYFADYPLDVCERIVSDLGTTPTVVFTLRNQVSAAGSMWQQFIKYGKTEGLDDWLRERFVALENRGVRDGKFLSRLYFSDLVTKWAGVVGEQNVLLVALDKANPNLLFDAFEKQLSLPEQFFANVQLDRRGENRSFSLDEAEMIRAINADLRDHPSVTWPRYQRLVRYGAIDPLLAEPSNVTTANQIQVPEWAAQKIAQITTDEIAKLDDLEIEVVGDLRTLAETPSAIGPNPTVDYLDVKTAAALATSVLKSGLKAVEQRRIKIDHIHEPAKHRRLKHSAIPLSAFVRAIARKLRRKFTPKKAASQAASTN